MRRFLGYGLAIAAAALLTAPPSTAGSYGKKDLMGSWSGDVMAMLEASGMMDQMPPGFDVAKLLEGFEIRVTFGDDGIVTLYNKTVDGERTETEKYEIASVKGNVFTVKSVDDEGNEEVVTLTFSDKDHMTMTTDEEDAPAMQFSRATKKEAETAKEAE